MDEELSRVLTELANRALDGVDGMTAFSAEHLPDVLVQLLWWHGVKSGVVFCFGLLVFWATYLIWKSLRKHYGGKDLTQYPHVVAFTVVGLPVLLGLSFLSLSNLDWLQILIAPKLYILEYAAGLVG